MAIQVLKSDIRFKHKTQSGNVQYSTPLDFLIVDQGSTYFETWNSQIQGIVNSINNNLSTVNNFCQGYKANQKYQEGSYIYYNNQLYYCTSTIQKSTNWDSDKRYFQRTTISNQLTDLFNNKLDKPANGTAGQVLTKTQYSVTWSDFPNEDVISTAVAQAVASWMSDNLTIPENQSYILDDSLTLTTAAAQAKATGDAINSVVKISAQQPDDNFNKIWIHDIQTGAKSVFTQEEIQNIIAPAYTIETSYKEGDYVIYNGALYYITADVNANENIGWENINKIQLSISKQINNLKDTLINVIAPQYTEKIYTIGDYCFKNNKLYKCNTAINIAEEWTQEHWTQVTTGAEISDLKSALGSKYLGYVKTTEFKQGNRAKDQLVPNGNASKCTTKDLFDLKSGDHVVVTGIASGQKYALAGVKNSAYVYDSGWKTEDLTFDITSAGSYFLNIAKTDSSNITPSDLSMTVIVYASEYQENVLNTSLANTLKEHNAYNLLNMIRRIIQSRDGITWEWTEDGGVYAKGTSTGTAIYNFFSTVEGDGTKPDWITEGETYNVDFSSTNVWFRVLVKSGEDTSYTNILDTKTSGSFTVPSGLTGIMLRLAVSGSGVAVNETVYPRIWSTDSNMEIKAVADSALELAQAVEITADKAKNAADNGHIITDEFVQGHRTNTIFPKPSNNKYRCTTKYIFHLEERYKIEVEGVTGSGVKIGIVGIKNGSYVYDSGWQTEDFSYIVTSGKSGDYFVNVYNDEVSLTPSDFSLTVNVWTEAQIINYKKTEDLSLFLGSWNPIVQHYKDFAQQTIDYDSNHSLIYVGTNKARWSLIYTPSKIMHLRMMNGLYVFRFYWYKDSIAHSTDWGTDWDVPVMGQTVGLTIKRKDGANFGGTEYAYLYLSTSMEDEKNYYTSEIASVVERVKAYNQEPGLTFLLSTDHHTMSVQGTLLKYDTVTDMAVNMRKIAEKVNVDAVVALGDIADFKVGNSTAFAKYGVTDLSYSNLNTVFYNWMDKAMDTLAAIHPNLIYTPGNHDDNRYINHDNIKADPSDYDYTKGQMYSYYVQRSQLRRVSNPLNNGLDYYIDFADQKIRLFCLTSSCWYETTLSWHAAKSWWYGFMQETVNWMTDQLEAIPDGWYIMIFTHFSPVGENNGDNNSAYPGMSDLRALIQNYISGGGKLIAELYGHSHCDWSTTTPWLDITFAAQKCQNPSLNFPNMPGMIVPTRTAATATEDCWNVVLVQPISKRIVCIRFGAGNDRIFHYEDMSVSTSTTLTTELSGMITWGSNNTTVATISDGVVSAVASGRAQITATDTNGKMEIWSIVVE